MESHVRPVVYIETTVPSFYHDQRDDVQAVAMRGWTTRWWDERAQRYELVTSPVTLSELDLAPEPKRSRALALLKDVPVLEVPASIEDIVDFYIERQLMPRDPTGDALNLAVASYHKCDFLLTWNCRNLANPEKFHHIRVLNNLLDLDVPVLTTPAQLLGAE